MVSVTVLVHTCRRNMGLLTCGCLNVKIHVKNTDLKAVDLTTLDGADAREEFFKQKISNAHLNLEGIVVEHWSLVKKKVSGLWTLHKCINCNIWTHSLKSTQGTSLVLVNTALQSEVTAIESLQNSPDFSPLYKVVLRDKNDNQPINTLGVHSEKYESLQQTLTTVQQQLNKFLLERENAMEERIRQFEESQRSEFASLQKKARQDKNNLIRMILSAEEARDEMDNIVQPQEVEPMHCVSPAKPVAVGFKISPDTRQQMGFNQSNTNTSNKPKVVKPTSKSASMLSSRLGHVPNKEPEAQLFEVDPTFDEEESRPFYNSDDEENEDTDDSELDSPANHQAMYSTSVPISVPAWKMGNKSRSDDLEEDDEPVTDPDNIAASIKALARSVHGDGSEIFGDLPQGPRPRYNTSGYM